jgi:glutamyl-tRNA(Gln) amidotransferase subunit D
MVRKSNKGKAEPGDLVIVKTGKGEREGRLLESYKPGIILIKLDSGYNIGIKKEDVIEIEVKKKLEKKKKKRKGKSKGDKPKIDMIITGGTISSRLDSETGAVSWLTNPEDLFRLYPELFDIVSIRKVKSPFMKASENMDYLDWKEIAREVKKSLNNKEVRGVIVTHGTDFLHYTSSALSFFLKNLNKPVVLTYSQRSSDRGSSDARLNLKCAAMAAISDIAEVMLVGHGTINDDFCYALRGSKVRKMHSSSRDAFKPVNLRPLAKIYEDKIETILEYNKRSKKKVELDARFKDSIALIKFYPGMDPEVFESFRKYEGIILEVAALGHVAIDEARKNLLPAIKKLINNGTMVFAVPQTIYGRLDPRVYSPGRKLKKTGVIFLKDILPETAYVKLGWVLGHKSWRNNPEKIKEKMLENISGEFNSRLQP